MLQPRAFAQENDVYALSPSRSPELRSRALSFSPEKPAASSIGPSPFKRGDGGAKPFASTSRFGRSAFSDKTNRSPQSKHDYGSPTKTPFQASPWKKQALVTPASNIGRAGQLKARIGQMQDPALSPLEQEETTDEPAPTPMTDDELYPPIEYMPPSPMRGPTMYDLPTALDGLPRAKEAATMLASAPIVGQVPADLCDDTQTSIPRSSLSLQPPPLPTSSRTAPRTRAPSFSHKPKTRVRAPLGRSTPGRDLKTTVRDDALGHYIDTQMRVGVRTEGFDL
ncbi:hypothetical protein ACI68E_003156 [Malassezia pachydermatis]|uniref:Uncharacterized protein n=1 Tax=Malassezia pachydermatis TaxID=77020 RepID=A0A0M8MK40_9BASI|nr:hypothetical protein Malapachy_3993 [Malassezia pachydermatis]KOS14076.1 hypothetical protein Malapachy_3993 [Malassezia pachydermatis]